MRSLNVVQVVYVMLMCLSALLSFSSCEKESHRCEREVVYDTVFLDSNYDALNPLLIDSGSSYNPLSEVYIIVDCLDNYSYTLNVVNMDQINSDGYGTNYFSYDNLKGGYLNIMVDFYDSKGDLIQSNSQRVKEGYYADFGLSKESSQGQISK